MGNPRRPGQNLRLTRHNRSSWSDEIDGYVQHMLAAGMSPTTIRLKRAHLERAFSWLDVSTPWAVTLEDLVDYLAAHDWAPESRKSVRSTLRGFYAWGEDRGYITEDPARRLPRVPVPQGIPHPTPTLVVHDAFSRAPARTMLMLKLAAFAGLRRAEIAGLHTDDIRHGTIVVRGKGGKVRDVPVHPALVDDLARRPRGFLFPGKDNGHLSPDRVGRIMADVLGQGWTAHSLRHRFATQAYAAERDLLTVQQLLGHSSVATTQRYTQVPDDARRRAVQAVA